MKADHKTTNPSTRTSPSQYILLGILWISITSVLHFSQVVKMKTRSATTATHPRIQSVTTTTQPGTRSATRSTITAPPVRTTRTTRATASIIQKQSAARSAAVISGIQKRYAAILSGFQKGELSSSQLSWLEEEDSCFEKQQAVDNLLELPNERNSTYLDSRRQAKWDNRYEMNPQCKVPIGERHPKILQSRRNGTYSRRLNEYYQGLPPKVNIPLAGTASNPAFPESQSNPKDLPNQSETDIVCL